MTTNVMVRDIDVAANLGDARRLEIVADGLPMFGGVQLAIDTTLVSACDATVPPFPDALTSMVQLSKLQKEEGAGLSGPRGRARLVVLAGKVGGRWSEETRDFLNQLARSKVRHEPAVLERWVTSMAP